MTEGHQRTNLGGSLCLALRGCRQLEAPSYRALRWGQRDPPARGKRTRKFSHPSQRASALSSPSVPASEVSVQSNDHETQGYVQVPRSPQNVRRKLGLRQTTARRS